MQERRTAPLERVSTCCLGRHHSGWNERRGDLSLVPSPWPVVPAVVTRQCSLARTLSGHAGQPRKPRRVGQLGPISRWLKALPIWGRRSLKIPLPSGSAGSSPAPGSPCFQWLGPTEERPGRCSSEGVVPTVVPRVRCGAAARRGRAITAHGETAVSKRFAVLECSGTRSLARG